MTLSTSVIISRQKCVLFQWVEYPSKELSFGLKSVYEERRIVLARKLSMQL